MFDHCFKVIDNSSQIRYPELGLKGVTQGLGIELASSSPHYWRTITDYLCKHIPTPTLIFIIKRMCSSYGAKKGTKNSQFAGRINDWIGQKRYAEFIKKFSVDDDSNIVVLLMEIVWSQLAASSGFICQEHLAPRRDLAL